MSVVWNPWHGCKKYSDGCKNCYVYRIDSAHGRDPSAVTRNADFSLPIKKKRSGEYKIAPGDTVYTCFSSDFLLDAADEWRAEAFEYMKIRSDLTFLFLTKRIERFAECMPDDWGDGYDNVAIGCTCENQKTADFRLPIFLSLPIKHRIIICEPLLTPIDLEKFLGSEVEQVVAGGESGKLARVCNYDWITDIRAQCLRKSVSFYFKQTGAKFVKNGKLYRVERRFQHSQAAKAGLNISFKKAKYLL